MQPPVAITALLLVSCLVLRVGAESGGQLGETTTDEEDSPRIMGCYALEPEEEEGTVNNLETANSSAALLRAQCYSACLEQV